MSQLVDECQELAESLGHALEQDADAMHQAVGGDFLAAYRQEMSEESRLIEQVGHNLRVYSQDQISP